MNILDIYFSKGVALPERVLTEILAVNQRSSQYGLILTAKEAAIIVDARNRALMAHGRVETGARVITGIIEAFSCSPFIGQSEYVEAISELVEIFYILKNETEDQVDDDELIRAMADYFNSSCQGSLDLLKHRELADYAAEFKKHPSTYGHEE